MPDLVPARKGQAVVLAIVHSSTNANFSRDTYTRWNLATVFEASRDGKVRKVIFAGSSHPVAVAYLGRCTVHTIGPDKQGAALDVIKASEAGQDYDSADDLRAAILGTRQTEAA